MAMLQFVKMQGAGNDFIMIDNRDERFSKQDKSLLAANLCRRAISVGADGMIFLESDPELPACWDFYNSDGSEAEMCGNGARCFTLFARDLGIIEEEFSFRTRAGIIRAEVTGDGRARVGLTSVPSLNKIMDLDFAGTSEDVYFINTGVPHVVLPVVNIEAIDVKRLGAAVRYHEEFSPAGTNVNFIMRSGAGIEIRTYERGVESETLACGTGSVAGAIVAGVEYGIVSPIAVQTRSGEILNVSFAQAVSGYTDIELEGPAKKVYSGEVML